MKERILISFLCVMFITGCSTPQTLHEELLLPKAVQAVCIQAVCKEVLPAYDADPATVSKVITLFSDQPDLVKHLREGWRPSGEITRPAYLPTLPLFFTPANAVREGKSGSARVVLIVDNAGHVSDARLLCTSDPVFEQAAVDITSKWIFRPALHNSRRVWSVIIASLEFPKR